MLLAEGISVAKSVDSNNHQIIIEDEDGELRRMRVKSGWINDGCIRYNHEKIPDQIDYLTIYVPKKDELYIVPRGQFESSIVLRVDEPKKNNSRINWAEDYRFP